MGLGIFDTPPRRKTRKKVPCLSETSGHIVIGGWLDRRGYFWFHPPMGGKRSKRSAKTLKLMGAKAGIPDFLILTPPPHSKYVGAAMELKREDGGDGGSDEQKGMLAKFAKCGWATKIVSGEIEAIEWLQSIGY